MSDDKSPFQGILQRLDAIAAPSRRLRERWEPLLKPYSEMAARIEAIVPPTLRKLQLSNPTETSYQRTTYSANGAELPPAILLPQETKPPPVKRPSTLEKNTERLKIYEDVVRELGRYAQKSVLLAEAAERAGCGVDSIKRAIGVKK